MLWYIYHSLKKVWNAIHVINFINPKSTVLTIFLWKPIKVINTQFWSNLSGWCIFTLSILLIHLHIWLFAYCVLYCSLLPIQTGTFVENDNKPKSSNICVQFSLAICKRMGKRINICNKITLFNNILINMRCLSRNGNFLRIEYIYSIIKVRHDTIHFSFKSKVEYHDKAY